MPPDWFKEAGVDATTIASDPERGTLYFIAWPGPDPDQLVLFEATTEEQAGAHLIVRPDGREVWTSSGEAWALDMLAGTSDPGAAIEDEEPEEMAEAPEGDD